MSGEKQSTFQKDAMGKTIYTDGELKRVYESSKLPDKPDYDKINKLLIKINRAALKL